jgi:uncharacterized protein
MQRKFITSLIMILLFISISINVKAKAGEPDKPTDLNAIAAYNQVNLSWIDNSDNELGYVIERKTGNLGNFEEITKLSQNTEFYLDLNLKNFTTYFYRVKAYNENGSSEPSNEASVTTEGSPPKDGEDTIPLAPSNLIATLLSVREVQLRWRDNSDNEEGFKLERKTVNSDYFVVVKTKENVFTYLDDSVNPDTIYYFRVSAFNANGESAPSNEVIIETKKGGGGPPDPEKEKPPLQPSDLIGELKEGVIYLEWKDNSTNEDGFRIYLAINSLENYALYAQLALNTTKFEESGLTIPGNTYFLKVTSFNKYGESQPTNEVMIRIKGDTANEPPNQPTNLEVTEIYENDLVIKWIDNSDNEDGFKLERRKSGQGKFDIITTLPKNMTAYRDEKLETNTTYYYRIYAYNSEGSSAPSNTIEAKTKSGNVPPENLVIVIVLKIGSKTISINGKDSAMDVTPTIIQGRTLLPIRYVVQALGGEVIFDTKTKKITIKLRDIIIEMWINNPKALINGKQVQIDPDNPNVIPMIVPPGRTMIPLRFVAENLGCKVEWNASEKTITIKYQL